MCESPPLLKIFRFYEGNQRARINCSGSLRSADFPRLFQSLANYTARVNLSACHFRNSFFRAISIGGRPRAAISESHSPLSAQKLCISGCVIIGPDSTRPGIEGDHYEHDTYSDGDSSVHTRLQSDTEKISDEDFFEFCQLNSDWRIERTSDGELIVMPMRGGIAGARSFTLTGIFGIWVRSDGTGMGFGSSTGFALPRGAIRSPSLAWVELSRWNALTEEERKKFPPLCPDFVVELRSGTDSIDALKDKMQEYIANGARLGWLIDPKEKRVYIYRPQAQIECLTNPATVSGDPLLRGFTLDLREIWP